MKKIILMLLLVLTLSLVSGCNKAEGELKGMKNISVEEIFNQEENNYLIYFHRIDCPDCEQADPLVINYSNLVNKVDSCSSKRDIYVVLLYTAEEKPGESVYIYRGYEGEDGQGTDGKFFVNGVTNWEGLYIGSTASLISISTRSSGEKVANYVAQGSEMIGEELEKQLGGCYS